MKLNSGFKLKIYRHKVRSILEIRFRVAPTVGIKRKHLKLTTQTKWNWSIKHFYTVDKLANLSPLEGGRVKSGLTLKKVRFVQTKFDVERIISIFRRVS